MPITLADLRRGGGAKGAERRNFLASRRGPITTTIKIFGIDTLATDLAAQGPLVNGATRGVLDFASVLGSNIAREIHRPHIDTGATFRSITPADEGLQGAGGNYWIEYGAETPQARFLEFGFVHNRSGQFIAYPFLIPSADVLQPLFEDAMVQIVEILGSRRIGSGPLSPPINATLNQFRRFLYSFSKVAGDVRVFGAELPGRGLAIGTARALTDVDAVMRGALAHRFNVRVTGRYALGSLRATVSASVSGSVAGSNPALQRIYNRISGRFGTRVLSDI